jgi:hypothetical protein
MAAMLCCCSSGPLRSVNSTEQPFYFWYVWALLKGCLLVRGTWKSVVLPFSMKRFWRIDILQVAASGPLVLGGVHVKLSMPMQHELMGPDRDRISKSQMPNPHSAAYQ